MTDFDLDARLVEDMCHSPDDDAQRLVWADAVGGERGELVVLQIDLERGELPAAARIARKRRQRMLLARHGAQWSGLAGLARRVSFRRGFVDAAEISAPLFLAHAYDIFEAAPLLQSVTITGLRADGPASDPVPLLAQLCAHPAARFLRGLALHCETTALVGDREPGDIAVDIVARSGLLANLRAFGSRDAIGAAGTVSLASARALHGLERLWLHEQHDAESLQMLLAQGLPALRSLDLGRRCTPGQVATLAPAVTELFTTFTDGVAAFRALEVLDLEDARGLAQLALLPRLRALSVHAGLAGLPPLTALRELSNTLAVRDEVARTLAETFGPQLDVLDLRNSHASLRHVNALKPHVAGELRVGEMHHTERDGRRFRAGLLRVGPMTQLPWWDHVNLEP